MSKIKKYQRAIVLTLAMAILTAYIARTAWLSDDAMITIRSVLMLNNGHGPVTTIGIRAQSFTHPLWFLLLSIVTRGTHEYIYSVIIFNVVVAATAYFLVVRNLKKNLSITIFVCLLLSSRTIIDYSTSGLENALSSLLLIMLFLVLKKAPRNQVLYFVSICSLLIMTRIDFVVFLIPLVFYFFRKTSHIRAKSLIVGMSPLFLWYTFSLVYYGTILPNTAYTKLNLNVSKRVLSGFGLKYLYESSKYDLFIVIFLAALFIFLVYSLLKKSFGFQFFISVGIAMYIIYIVSIGGDFMAGRLLSPFMFLFIVIVLFSVDSNNELILKNRSFNVMKISTGLAIVIVLLTLSTSWMYILSSDENVLANNQLVGDERSFYALRGQSIFLRQSEFSIPQDVDYLTYKELFNLNGKIPNDGYLLYETSKAISNNEKYTALPLKSCRGLNLLLNPYKTHVIDHCGLIDPILSRTPVVVDINHFRPGHYLRTVDEAYDIYKEINKPQYHEIKLLTTGKLFTTKRLGFIAKNFFSNDLKLLI